MGGGGGGGGGFDDGFFEGSVLGAAFWGWWKRAWVGGEEGRVESRPATTPKVAIDDEQQGLPAVVDDANSQAPSTKLPPPAAAQEFVCITAVVPRPRPPRRPAKSKPIDIPVKKAVSVRVFEEVAEDKRYWYQ